MAGDFWRSRRVLLTGGSGFLGRRVEERLRALGPASLAVPRHGDFDLTRQEDVARLFREHPADVVLHLAARAGGIGVNDANPGLFLYETLMMGLLVMEQARLSGASKFVQIASATMYPLAAPAPYREESLWSGPVAETHRPHAAAKLALLEQARAYRRQYGFRAATLIAPNLYGPGDSFDPARARVIPALIGRCLAAKAAGEREIAVWGTGRAARDFLYVDDAAQAVLLAAERWDEAEPANIGSGAETSIAELARLIARLTGYAGGFRFDASRPEGQPRQLLDVARAREGFGFRAAVPLEEGLRRTVAWRLSQTA